MKRFVILLLLSLLTATVPAQQRKTNTRKPVATQQKGKKQTTKKQTTNKKTKKQTTKKPAAKQPATVKGLQNERKALQAQRAANQRKQEELKRGVKRGMENLMILDQEIAEKRKVVDTIRNDISRLSEYISLLDRQLIVLEEELEQRRNRYMKSMRYMHRNRSAQDQFMFVFSADNFNQMYRRLRFSREYAAYQRAQGEAVKSKQQQVEDKKRELAESRHEKSALLARGEQEKKNLEGKQNEQQNQVNKLKKQQKTVEALILEQQRREAELNARIDKLIAEEIAREKARQEAEAKKRAEAEAAKKRAEELARKKAAAEAARRENERRIAEARKKEENARRKAQQAASQKERAEAERRAREAENERREAELRAMEDNRNRQREIAEAKKVEETFREPAEDRRLSGSFEQNRGRLPLPISGAYRLVRGFGTYSPEGLSHVKLKSNGWHLKGQSGAKAQSVFDGVVSGVYFQGGSYIVTVRHGKYISAYINLAQVSVRKGQKVKARQALGSLGPDQTMQFQLRNWNTLLNPGLWIGR
ncbi:peptidoglycan DD-metalloendopeptidase family protein [Prevotella sp. E9-3]|uniref:peptidoglycan DD-metalloendopeptidase family protein n=1 Tax=Prevotella sp. E9-3 TaxID=2913621 RepID=UPI001EDBD608|nr:peptidoglycan DD-metalloendopeptidase family protein [Prevotella sp. E9-3]UKK48285.1 peptidoglycan DD-metalloendopeptidase family protein [Prevotella sp. E9-3]